MKIIIHSIPISQVGIKIMIFPKIEFEEFCREFQGVFTFNNVKFVLK